MTDIFSCLKVLVGSSMGGWLALLATMERTHRVHSLVGIATAADFDLNITDEVGIRSTFNKLHF